MNVKILCFENKALESIQMLSKYHYSIPRSKTISNVFRHNWIYRVTKDDDILSESIKT